jgi:hypothetical protein
MKEHVHLRERIVGRVESGQRGFPILPLSVDVQCWLLGGGPKSIMPVSKGEVR